MRFSIILISLMFLIFYIPNSYSVCNYNEFGDWNINSKEVCDGINITINGNINISNIGYLILNNSILNFNVSTSPVNLKITNYGNLSLFNSEILLINKTNRYEWRNLNSNSNLKIINSSVSGCGWGYGVWSNRVIYIESNNVSIIDYFFNTNKTFTSNLIFINTSNHQIINNSFFSANYDGSDYAWNIVFINTNDSFIINNNMSTDGHDVNLVYLIDSYNNEISNNDFILYNYNNYCPGTAIDMSGSNDNLIFNNTINLLSGYCSPAFFDHYGINLYGSNNNNISGNNISIFSDSSGIYLDGGSSYNYFLGNNIFLDNESSIGIDIDEGDYNEFYYNNILIDLGLSFNFNQFIDNIYNVINDSNLINGKKILLIDDFNNPCLNNSIHSYEGIHDIYYLRYSGCSNISITNLDLVNSDGLYIFNVSELIIKDSVFENNNYGIKLDKSPLTIIENISSNDNINGLYVSNSDSTNIFNSNFDNSDVGIYIFVSNNIIIDNVQVTNSVKGILFTGNNNLINNSKLYYNQYPIYFGDYSANILKNSHLINNDYNFYFYRTGHNGQNYFYNNTFINRNPGFWAFGLYYLNTWDDGSFGNYWGWINNTGFSQTCIDSDFNNICDNSYNICTSNIDNYPSSNTTVPLNLIINSHTNNDDINNNLNSKSIFPFFNFLSSSIFLISINLYLFFI